MAPDRDSVCSICGQVFVDLKSLLRHTKMAHVKKPRRSATATHKCSICGWKATSRRKLKAHCFKEHNSLLVSSASEPIRISPANAKRRDEARVKRQLIATMGLPPPMPVFTLVPKGSTETAVAAPVSDNPATLDSQGMAGEKSPPAEVPQATHDLENKETCDSLELHPSQDEMFDLEENSQPSPSTCTKAKEDKVTNSSTTSTVQAKVKVGPRTVPLTLSFNLVAKIDEDQEISFEIAGYKLTQPCTKDFNRKPTMGRMALPRSNSTAKLIAPQQVPASRRSLMKKVKKMES